MTSLPPTLPEQAEKTIGAIANLHADHRRSATSRQRAVERLVDLLGRPGFVGLLLGAVVCWIGGNLLVSTLGNLPIDVPPFPWLELVVSVIAVCITVLILTTQRRDDQLGRYREQLTLELAILSEQKLAKIIQLLEESRRDNPLLNDREDTSANAMTVPADPQSLADAIKRRHDEAYTSAESVTPNE